MRNDVTLLQLPDATAYFNFLIDYQNQLLMVFHKNLFMKDVLKKNQQIITPKTNHIYLTMIKRQTRTLKTKQKPCNYHETHPTIFFFIKKI